MIVVFNNEPSEYKSPHNYDNHCQRRQIQFGKASIGSGRHKADCEYITHLYCRSLRFARQMRRHSRSSDKEEKCPA